MRLIAIAKLREAASIYPDISNQIEDFYQTIRKVHWQNLIDVQNTFASAEAVGTLDSSFKSGNPPNGLSRNFTIINIKGNKYRLILDINYKKQLIFFKYFLTHAEYSKDKWKNDSHYQS